MCVMQVAAGAAHLYVQELASIKRLSESGAAQLAADLDYFCNVLTALGVALPPQLVTWQVILCTNPKVQMSCAQNIASHLRRAQNSQSNMLYRCQTKDDFMCMVRRNGKDAALFRPHLGTSFISFPS